MKITSKVLKTIDACDAGINFFTRNNLEGFPLNRLNEIKGDYQLFTYFLLDADLVLDDSGSVLQFWSDEYLSTINVHYNSTGTVSTLTNDSGFVVKEFFYNKNNQLQKEIILYEDRPNFCKEYDQNGNLTKTYHVNIDGTQTNTRVLQYDSHNNCIKDIQGNYITLYTYDSHNNCTLRIQCTPKGNQITKYINTYNTDSYKIKTVNDQIVEYDNSGNVLKIYYVNPSKEKVLVRDHKFCYHKSGSLHKIINNINNSVVLEIPEF